MKEFYGFVALFIFSFVVNGQGIIDGPPQVIPKCELGLNKAPAIRGFKLGMDEKKAAEITGVEFKPIYPLSSNAKSLQFLPHSTPGFEEVYDINLNSIEGKVSSIWITYAPKWKSEKEFASHFIPQIDLPKESWEEPGNDQGFVITCTDFTLRLTARANQTGTLSLRDTAVDRKKAEELARIEEARRKALKP